MIRFQNNSVTFKSDADENIIQGALKASTTGNQNKTSLEALNGSNEATISVSVDKTGLTRTEAPSPSDTSNDKSIATTEWVKARIAQASIGGGGAAPDLSNYVDLSSTQTITGTKTFNDIKAKTPSASDNSTKVATTAWVNVKVNGLTGTDLSNYVDLSGTQTITGTKTFNDIKAKTPSASDNSTKVATTAWVNVKVNGLTGTDLSNYVDLGSTQTISGAKTFSAVVKAKTPAADSDDTSVATTAWVKAKVGTGSVDTSKVVDLTSAQTISGAKTFSSVTKSATPATGSDDTSVATTAWVNTKVRGLTGSDPSNYVDLSSTQTITGTKTFNDLKTVTPSASDNSTKVATTAWVKAKVDAVSEANKTETVASFSADMTVNDDSATYSILTSASTITVANGADTKGWSKCVKIENAGATISLGSSWSWKDGSQPTLTAPCLLCLVWIGNLGVAGVISTTAA